MALQLTNTNTAESLADLTLDNVEDLVGWENPIDGQHVFSIVAAGIEQYLADDEVTDRIYVVYCLRKTLAKANAKDPDSTIGSLHKEMFTAKGLEYFKKLVKNLLKGEDLTGISIGSMCAAIQEAYTNQANFSAVVKNTTSKSGFESVRMSKITPVAIIPLPDGLAEPEYIPTSVEEQ